MDLVFGILTSLKQRMMATVTSQMSGRDSVCRPSRLMRNRQVDYCERLICAQYIFLRISRNVLTH